MDVVFKFNYNYDLCLSNPFIKLVPLQEKHFNDLFLVACDPLIWEQHPNPNRYQQSDFTVFFNGAVTSDNAFLIVEKATNEIMGCTRFYDFDAVHKSVFIGYTFIARKFWGKGINQQVKKIMIDYAFIKVDTILFHIGATNIRSQIAILRIGAQKIGEELVEYFGEQPKLNFIYKVTKN